MLHKVFCLIVFLTAVAFPNYFLFFVSWIAEMGESSPAVPRVYRTWRHSRILQNVPLSPRCVHCTLLCTFQPFLPPFPLSSGTPELCTFQETVIPRILVRQHFAIFANC